MRIANFFFAFLGFPSILYYRYKNNGGYDENYTLSQTK